MIPTSEKPLPGDEVVSGLKRRIRGTIYRRSDTGFVRHSQLFNGAIRSHAQLLVRPIDTKDVSEIVKFCAQYNLSPSVKSGGYGTHGWAVEGDIIIDMRLIAQITIERPLTDPDKPDWSSLHDSPHVPVADPDTLKSKGRMPSTLNYPNAYPPGVGPPSIHAPFTEPRRRSTDEAFPPSPVLIIPPDSTPGSEDKMQIDGVGEKGSSYDSGSERPTRRLRVISSGSSRTSHASSTSTPPTTASPSTPAGEFLKPNASEKDQITATATTNAPSLSSQVETGKTTSAVTPREVEQDEGMVPPSSDRPGIGVNIRGYAGRDVDGWDTVWHGYDGTRTAPESVGITHAMRGGASVDMGGSFSLWAPAPGFNPPGTISVSPTPMTLSSRPRSIAPPTTRPFDFSQPAQTPPTEVNAFINPHAATRASTSGSGVRPARPVDYGPPDANHALTPVSPPKHPHLLRAQKDVDAFCAAHPLAAFVANSDGADGVGHAGVGGVDGIVDDVVDGKRPTVVADSACPELYERPTETGHGPGSGSFFGPSSRSYFAASSTPSPPIPYFVPFAAHPVGSSVMLLGGFGFLSRLHGLSMDCLVEAEVVLPDGRIVWVSKEGVRGEDGELWDEEDGGEGWGEDGTVLGETSENEGDGDQSQVLEADVVDRVGPSRVQQKEKQKEKEREQTPAEEETEDAEGKPRPKRGLWWALRGAGPAFGVVVSNFNKLTAASLIKHFRGCIKAAPRELYANCILTAGPKNKGALIVIQICYAGSRAEGLPFLQAISSWEGEGCLLNEVQEKEFVWQQDSLAKVLKGGAGRKWFIRSDLISSLTDEIIHQTVKRFGDTPDGCTWLFELSGGALTDTTDTCLPKVPREAAFTIVALHQWKLEDNDPACVLTAEEWIKEALSTPVDCSLNALRNGPAFSAFTDAKTGLSFAHSNADTILKACLNTISGHLMKTVDQSWI
ncbi:hypothetical protein FRC12_013555 [Ceratobasidium sp. 428]|nr:hypothetical protein FRC12_013555 [Ceratobasidium sp. 428]